MRSALLWCITTKLCKIGFIHSTRMCYQSVTLSVWYIIHQLIANQFSYTSHEPQCNLFPPSVRNALPSIQKLAAFLNIAARWSGLCCRRTQVSGVLVVTHTKQVRLEETVPRDQLVDGRVSAVPRRIGYVKCSVLIKPIASDTYLPTHHAGLGKTKCDEKKRKCAPGLKCVNMQCVLDKCIS